MSIQKRKQRSWISGSRDEAQLQKWKIIDYVAVPTGWMTFLSDHWPVITNVRTPCKKESWIQINHSFLKGWRPKTESDEAGFCRSLVESLEDAENILGDVSIEDISKNLPKAARAVEFESVRGRNKAVRETYSLDVKQAFDNVSPLNLSLVMKEINIAPTLAGAILREQIGGKYDVSFQDTRVLNIPFDKSSPSIFNLMMKSTFRKLQNGRTGDGC